jgi:hypothetical protein
VGDEETVGAYAGAHTQRVDLHGATVTPGFTDCHVHLEDYTRYDRSLDTMTSRQAVLDRIRARHQELAPGAWLYWRASLPEPALWPTRAELDQACEGRPVILGVSGAANVLSSSALAFVRPDPQTVGARVDAESGVLNTKGSGGLQHVLPDAPLTGKEQTRQGILTGLGELTRAGITMVHHMIKERLPLEIYQDLHDARALPARIGVILRGWESDIPLDAIIATGFRQGFGDKWLGFQGVKISVDGYFPLGGAYFTEPYANDPGTTGRLRIEPDQLNDFISRANRAGLRIAVHANGDGAIDLTLDAFEAALEEFPRTDPRHRMEHVGNIYLTPKHVERMRRLGIVAVPNPPFLHRRAHQVLPPLGPDRAQAPVAVKSFLDGGVRTVAASDYSGLYPADPIVNIWGLTSRISQHDGQVYAPDQAISGWDALRLYTTEPAWLSFGEHQRGTIEAGKLADLTVLAADPVTTEPAAIAAECQVLATIVGGRASHATGDFTAIAPATH